MSTSADAQKDRTCWQDTAFEDGMVEAQRALKEEANKPRDEPESLEAADPASGRRGALGRAVARAAETQGRDVRAGWSRALLSYQRAFQSNRLRRSGRLLCVVHLPRSSAVFRAFVPFVCVRVPYVCAFLCFCARTAPARKRARKNFRRNNETSYG